MKLIVLFFLTLPFLLPAGTWHSLPPQPRGNPESAVVPRPQKMNFSGELTTVGPNASISPETETPLAAAGIKRLKQQLLHESETGESSGAVSKIVVRTAETPERREGYTLVVSDCCVTITGNSDRGTLYGIQTLRQLLAPTGTGLCSLPVGTIEDWPDLAWRGAFTSGISSSETNQILLETMSLLKLNYIIIRVDQWLKYECVPSLSHPTAARSKAEYRAFVHSARELGIEVIPNTSLYTHFGWALWTDYGYLLEVPQGAISHFSLPEIDHPDTPGLIRTIMEETVEAFDRPRYYHVGQDELKLAPRPPDVPNGRSRREKFKTALDLLKKNCDDLNVRMMMWSDQLLDSYNGGAPDHTSQLRSTLSREIILCDWNYFGTNGFSELKLLAQEGFEVLGSAWYDLTTISAYADAQKQTPGVLGMLATTWSGIDGYFQIPEHPGALVWAAEESWSNGRPFLCDYPCRPADVFYRLSHLAAPRIRSVLPLDLSKIAMTPRSGEESMFGRGRELDFSSLPMWIQWEDFRFELPQNTLILGGRGSQLPQQVEIAFQPEYADSIAFAHVTDLPARRALAFTTLDNKAFYDPGEIAVYTILYTDGDREEIPINYTREITDWNEPAGAAVAPIVWQGWSENGKMLQINGFRWDNPHPEKAIETIVFTAGKSPVSLAVFAVSLERKKIKER